MRIVFFASYYPAFMDNFLRKYPGLNDLPYKTQMALLSAEHFGPFDAYAHYAANAGHETHLIIGNCEPMQRKWAAEHNIDFPADWKTSLVIKQMEYLRPDVFFMGSMFYYYGKFLDAIKPYCNKIYGWVACPIPEGTRFNQFDLMLSSAHSYVKHFRGLGVNSELLPAAFDIRVWNDYTKKNTRGREVKCSFIGSLSSQHHERVETLREVARKIPLKIWGHLYKEPMGFWNRYFRRDPIGKALMGEAWGMDMYGILADSLITLNVHIAESKDQAGNMRMYEATGMGALLLTDKKTSGDQLWTPGKHVVEYNSIPDLVDKVRYYLNNEKERAAIAAAGQAHTHERYNFTNNMKLMLAHFEKYL